MGGYMGGYLSPPSANVTLIHKLCLATLKDFKKYLSLKQLKEHVLVQVCNMIQKKQYNPLNSVKEISNNLKTKINKLNFNDFELVESTQK